MLDVGIWMVGLGLLATALTGNFVVLCAALAGMGIVAAAGLRTERRR